MSLKQNILEEFKKLSGINDEGDFDITMVPKNHLLKEESSGEPMSWPESHYEMDHNKLVIWLESKLSLIEQEVRKCVDAPYGTTDMGTPEYEKGLTDGLRTARGVIKTSLDKLFNSLDK